MSNAGLPQELTPTVEFTAQKVIEQAVPSQLVLVEGLSGVGKTALMNRIRPEIEAGDGIVIAQEQLELNDIKPDTTDRPVVVAATVTKDFWRGSFHRRAQEMFPDRESTEIILPGMPASETEDFVAKLPRGEIAPDLVAYFSMGVPLLARRFAAANSADGVTQRGVDYLRQAAKYNATDLEDMAARYLQMAIPTELLPGRSKEPSGSIYSSLRQAERERAELAKRGIIEESPLFVAPESEQVYNSMLQSEGGPSDIDIFIPSMSEEDLKRVHEALGYDPDADWYGEHGPQTGEYNQNNSTRADMFSADFRKASFWFRDGSGYEHEFDNEYSGPISAKVNGYQEAFASGKLGLPGADTGDITTSMWMHSHEHDGLASHTAMFGWMVESLLQQRGIAYFVNNDTANLSYAYLPYQQRLEILPERVKIKRYPWET